MTKLLNLLDLKSDLDNVDAIHKSIRDGIIFRGTNLWILVFAIILASVGLNTNSTAVIIGAMLISPLMGPINGMGYSIATYDFVLFRRSLKNFGFAVGASLATSTLYFLITPISTAHSELLARTSPTIYDVLIALFGGLAGIVAISSRHKGNIIPGVAIATALMPPLCTAGFGIATGQLNYFFGAFYLFTINTVFIGISSVLFSQLLNFPIRTVVEPSQKNRINRWITIVILITIIPSIYFGYLLVLEERFSDRANKLITNVGAVDGSYLLRNEINASKRTIKLVYGGASLTQENKNTVLRKAMEFGMDKAEITFEQGFSFADVSDDINRVDLDLRAELNKMKAELQKQQRQQDSLQNSVRFEKQLLKEIQIIYPQVSAIGYTGEVTFSTSSDSLAVKDSLKTSMVILSVQNKFIGSAERQKMEQWLQARLQSPNTVKILYDINEDVNEPAQNARRKKRS